MTRWARGGPVNHKRAHDSTPWTQLAGSIPKSTHKGKDKHKIHKEKFLSKHSGTKHSKEFVKNEFKREKTFNRGVDAEPRKSLIEEDIPAKSGLAADLEKLKSSVSLSKEDELEISEVIKKDERREKRRIKRLDEKQSQKVCFNCRQTGHEIADCPEVKKDQEHGTGICFKCGSTEHGIYQCREKLPAGVFPYAKCFICGETGHLSRECPDNPRGLYPKGGCCRSCGSVEHYRKDCPDLQKKQGGPDMTLSTMESSISMDEEFSLQKQHDPKPKKKMPKVVKF